jgi:hypothetical protein
MTSKISRADYGTVFRSRERKIGLSCAAAILTLAFAATSASARPAVTFATEGHGAGQVSYPDGVAVDQSGGEPTSGDVYIAEANNRRVDVFNGKGEFQLAFGWGVRGSEPAQQLNELQACTIATACQAGIDGSEPGEFGSGGKLSVAVDNNPSSLSFHDMYVSEPGNHRVQEFTPAGAFVEMFGKEVDEGPHHPGNVCTAAYLAAGDVCGAGASGTEGKGEFDQGGIKAELPVAVDAAGDVWVGDDARLQEFTPEGVFVRELALPSKNLYEVDVQSLAVEGEPGEPFAPGGFYVSTAAVDETQRITPASGSFTLSFEGQTTPELHSTGEIVGALEKLSTVGKGNVVSVLTEPGFAYVGFVGALAETSLPPIAISAGSVTVEQGDKEQFGARGEVLKLGPGGEELGAPFDVGPSGHPQGLALAPTSKDLFVEDQEVPLLPGEANPNPQASVFEYGPTGAFLEGFGTGGILGQPRGNALAFGEAAQALYVVSCEASFAQIVFPAPPGPQFEEGKGSVLARPVGKTTATLNATINPEEAATTYHFEYITQAAYEKNVEEGKEPFTGAISTPTPEGSLPAEYAWRPVSVTLAGLTLETTYRFRAVASNPNVLAGPIVSEEAVFTTEPAVRIDSTYATEVSSTSASLGAELNPLGEAASYRFEYLTEAAYQKNIQEGSEPFAGASLLPGEGEAAIASGEADVGVSELAEGLSPATVYRYRVVARDALGPSAGADRTFTTQAAASATSGLLDGRAWELVSPPNAHGTALVAFGIGSGGGLIQAAEDGDALTYIALGPVGPETAGNRGSKSFNQLLAQRSSSSGIPFWSTRDIATPHEAVEGPKLGGGSEYEFFSPNLSAGLVEPEGATPLSPQASEKTPYLRDNNKCEPTATEAIPATCYTPLVTGKEGFANVLEGTEFGGKINGGQQTSYGVQFLAATPDLSHVVLHSEAQLTSAPYEPEHQRYVYEWSAGRLQPLDVLPVSEGGGGVSAIPLRLGTPKLETETVTFSSYHELSDDGSVFFDYRGHLYFNDLAAGESGESIRIDKVLPGSGLTEPTGGAEFLYASADGSRVLFSDPHQLTAATGGGIYECRIVQAESGLGCELSLTALSGTPAELVGGSEDATWLYFLNGGRLIVDHYGEGAWTTTDGPVIGGVPSPHGNPAYRVSPNGHFLAFMSAESLTGFDNTDAYTAELEVGTPTERHTIKPPYHDQEVFEYNALSNHLICASCDPTGARPAGIYDRGLIDEGEVTYTAPLVDRQELWQEHWLAGSIPGFTYVGDGSYGLALDQPRYLDDSGRLFFDSPVGLVPQDGNGVEDVYEYEPEGTGPESARCGPGSDSGVEVFKPAHAYEVGGVPGEEPAGCVGLISSGSSSEESAFLDASGKGPGGEEGEDVFFMTASRLVPADVDDALHIYDAHECSTAVPCPPPPGSVPPACTTAESCRAASPPQPGIYGPPPSATFSGEGNLAPAAPAAVVKPKPTKCKHGFAKKRVKEKELCVKVKSKRKAKAKKSAHTNRRAR